jgi:hypothetical protein
MICGSDGILAKATNDNGKIANGSAGYYSVGSTADCTRASGTRGPKPEGQCTCSLRTAHIARLPARQTPWGGVPPLPAICLSGAKSDDGWQGGMAQMHRGTAAQGRAHRSRSRYLPPPPTSARMPPPYVSYQLELRVDRWGPSPRRNSAQSTRPQMREPVWFSGPINRVCIHVSVFRGCLVRG